MRPRVATAVALLAIVAAPRIAAEPPPAAALRRAVMISIDGLPPAAYLRPDELGLAVPNLRRLAREGAFASGVVGVLPSVTYPSHTTLVTGVPPARHGIPLNTFFDPLDRSRYAWRWYARDIREITLAGAMRARGRSTAAISWPVSVGLEVDELAAEFWRSDSTHPSDIELLRALSTPGLFDAAEARRGRPITAPLHDPDRIDLAIAALERRRPELMLVHLLEVDKAEHTYGPWSNEAKAAIEAADIELGRLLAAYRSLDLLDETLVLVVSDHGFRAADRLIRPNTLLAAHGLIDLDERGNVVGWRAWVHSEAGSAELRIADPADETSRSLAVELLTRRAAEAESGIGAILSKATIAELGGDPDAELFLEAAEGFTISRSATGGWFGKPTDRGFHGWDPRRPEMHASLLMLSPRLERRGDLGIVPMTGIAPTIAAWLGIELSAHAATPILAFEAAGGGR